MVNKDVPQSALTFTVATEFGDNGDGAKSAPVKLLARTGQPISHWFWGNVVHDLAGMKMSKPRIPIDYVHDPGEVLGYVNKTDTSSGDLVLSGAVTPFKDGDRASEVLFKSRAGVPYEASINFAGPDVKVQEVGMDEVVDVNGYQFEGPGIVIRQWTLRGVAICPYGADPGTATNFTKSDAEKVSVSFLNTETRQMSNTNTPAEGVKPVDATNTPAPVTEAKPATPPASAVELTEGKPAEGVKPVDATPKPGAAFIACFGDAGARAFLEGKSFEDATREFVGAQKSQHEAAIEDLKSQFEAEKTAHADTKAKLAAVKLGNDSVAFRKSDDNADAKPNEFAGKLSDNLAKVAAAIKLPGQNSKTTPAQGE